MRNLIPGPRGGNASHPLRDFTSARYEVNLFDHWQKHHGRLETLIEAILAQDGTRIPGVRRFALRAQAEREGISLPQALFDEISALAR